MSIGPETAFRRVIQNVVSPTREDFGDEVIVDEPTQKIKLKSAAHGRTIRMDKFDVFLREQVPQDVVLDWPQDVRTAAQLVLDGVDLRKTEYDGQVGILRLDLHKTYLALACQTQFVERMIKEAKHVSTTDRNEEHRTWLAIIRSATPLGRAKTDVTAERIRAIVNSTIKRVNLHVREEHTDEYKARFKRIVGLLSNVHFKQERIQEKLDVVDNEGSKFKKLNVIQKTKQQHLTPAVTGLIPYGKIFQKRDGHMEGLEAELVHRGMPIADVQTWKITARKDKLKQLEIQRLMEEGVPQKDAQSLGNKHFKVLSEFKFDLTNV